jgi:hypothetical protein
MFLWSNGRGAEGGGLVGDALVVCDRFLSQLDCFFEMDDHSTTSGHFCLL